MRLVQADIEKDCVRIRDIYNYYIINTNATYRHEAMTLVEMEEWLLKKNQADFPVITAVNDAGEIIGFGTYGNFRDIAGYSISVENSLYIDHNYMGQGAGLKILEWLITHAKKNGKHNMIAVIDSKNLGSIALHKKFGFILRGQIPQAATKKAALLDVEFYSLILN